MTVGGSPEPPWDAAGEAARWDARLRSPLREIGDRAEFAAWRQASPDNAAAFDALQQTLATLKGAASHDRHLIAMRQGALRQAKTPLGAMVAAGIAALFVFGVASTMVPQGSIRSALPHFAAKAPADDGLLYRTRVGHRSDILLTDGSRIVLDSRSALRVAYSATERRITLESGRALFEVAKDRSRPFIVTAGGRSVTATGTMFDVSVEQARTLVTMLEGRVLVARLSSRGSVRPLVAGQQIVMATAGGDKVQSVNAGAVSAWRNGKLIFDATPLQEAVAQINRYSASPIVIRDKELEDMPISGMFLTGRPSEFVTAITEYFSISAEQNADGSISLERHRS